MDDTNELFGDLGAVFFDLFDTLIRIDPERLPRVEVAGTVYPSTVPGVHALVGRRFGDRVSVEEMLSVLRDIWVEISQEKEEDWREISAVERFRRMLDRLGLLPHAEAGDFARELAEHHMRTLAGAAVPMERAREIVERVRERGMRTALISNFDYAPATEWILANAGLDGLLDALVVSDALGVRKPHERIFRSALEGTRTTPERALHIGDMPRQDAWGAGRLGMRTVWINPRREGYPVEEHPPTLTVERLAELEPLLR